jgi:tyrosyl-tRNA synthetase
MDDINTLRSSMDPISAKKDLAKRIVTDFHSADEADAVAASWGDLPDVDTLEHVSVSDSRLNRLLTQARFAPSVTEADKLIKANGVAVYIVPGNQDVAVTGPAQRLDSGEYIVRVGKRYKHVKV